MKDEYLWKIYDANKEWIKFADTKAIAFIAIIGVIFNVLYNMKSFVFCLENNNIIKIFYIFSIVFLFLSLILSVCCLIPRKSEVKDKNIIYYESISKNFSNEEEYHSEIKNKKNYTSHLISQIYQLANVASDKYCTVKISLILFSFGIFVFVLFLLFSCLGWSFNVQL